MVARVTLDRFPPSGSLPRCVSRRVNAAALGRRSPGAGGTHVVQARCFGLYVPSASRRCGARSTYAAVCCTGEEVRVTFSRAIDLYLGDLARQGRRPSTLETYRRLLNDFADVVRDRPPAELMLEDYERFLDRWITLKPSTLASGVSLVRGFSRFLHERGYAAEFVAEPLKRPRRPSAEELEVVTISAADVARMLDGCGDWQELLCVATAAYTGARRKALANVRLADVDLVGRTIRFHEKGGKVVAKPIADEY